MLSLSTVIVRIRVTPFIQGTKRSKNLDLHRCLTTQETSAALRPFFFAVHPDLFGQYPKERAVNEESIKHLNEHLEKIRGRARLETIRLQFFMRQRNDLKKSIDEETFHKISITLPPASIQNTVQNVLQSCSLPLDYVQSIKPQATQTRTRQWKVKFEPAFYRKYGIRNPYDDGHKIQQLVTLSDWLKQNLTMARAKQSQMRPIRAQVEGLEAELVSVTGVKGLVWASDWGQAQYRTALKGLLRVCVKHSINLRDKRVIFQSSTGISSSGDIILCSDDVAENWVSALTSYSRYDPVFHKLPSAELYLSSLLGGIQVTRTHPSPPLVQVYLQQVRRLTSNVKNYLQDDSAIMPKQGLNDLKLIVECLTGALLVSPSGEFRVPSSTPGFLIIDFLNKQATVARQRHLVAQRTSEQLSSLESACKDRLCLRSLRAADNLSPDQYVSCLQKLLRDAPTMPVHLEACRLQITQFYSLRSDGEMCVPWNYETLRTTRR